MTMHQLLELEKQGWHALCAKPENSRAFYNSVLRDDATMAFPGDLVIKGKKNILDSLATQPWKTFQIENPQLVTLVAGAAALLVYRVVAHRERSTPYTALISSTYVRQNDEWKMVFHQHTPV